MSNALQDRKSFLVEESSDHLCLVLAVYLPVPSKIFPHDRHRDIHDVVGRPQLVQRAVLVVDPLQENLAHSVFLLSHQQPPPLLPCLLQDCQNLRGSSPIGVPVVNHVLVVGFSAQSTQLQILSTLLTHRVLRRAAEDRRRTLVEAHRALQLQLQAGGQVLQAPPIVIPHVQVDVLHGCHHQDSFKLAIDYCSHDRSHAAIAVPLVQQNTRYGQQLAQDCNIVFGESATGVVQRCVVEVVLGVHINARLCQQQIHHLLVVCPYCLHQTGPVVTSTPGVGVSSSKKKLPQLLHLAKAAQVPEVVLLCSHHSFGNSLQNKQQGMLRPNPKSG